VDLVHQVDQIHHTSRAASGRPRDGACHDRRVRCMRCTCAVDAPQTLIMPGGLPPPGAGV